MTERNGTSDYNTTRAGLLAAGLTTVGRPAWIERTGQDPDDPSTWNRTAVDVIREHQRAARN